MYLFCSGRWKYTNAGSACAEAHERPPPGNLPRHPSCIVCARLRARLLQELGTRPLALLACVLYVLLSYDLTQERDAGTWANARLAYKGVTDVRKLQTEMPEIFLSLLLLMWIKKVWGCTGTMQVCCCIATMHMCYRMGRVCV